MENTGDSVLCLFIEPYGEDYWLNPGDAFTVGPIAEGIDVWFSTFISRDCVTVWLYKDGDPSMVVLDYAVVDADGASLDCGHQRPPRPPDSRAG